MDGSWRRLNVLITGTVVALACASYAQDTPPTSENEPPKAEEKADPQRPAAEPAASTEPRPAPAIRPGAPSEAPDDARTIIREPSQGRPIFIVADETFYFVMRLPAEPLGDVGFALSHALEPSVRVALRPKTEPSYVNNEYCTLVLNVPPGTQPGLYDLEVRAKNATYRSPRSVKVVDQFKTKFRFVHLSSMNVGDLTAPDFDGMLPDEINLLAPEFIIATGDYTQWARARDDAASWPRILEYFERFNAPVFMLCGLHDHEESFGRYVGKKIDTIDYGAYHGLLLLDHPGHAIDQDYAQLQWIDDDLKRNRNKRLNFLAGYSDEMALLDIWRERGGIESFIKDHKIKLYLAGGSTDWDYKEFADKIRGLDDLNFVRTHQSSTCLRDRATGFSHYRVIDVDGDKLAYVYPDDNAVEKAQHSVPTGRLRAFLDGPNDGRHTRVTATVQNALNQGFADARVWLRVRKDGDAKPTVGGGRVVQTLDAGTHWAVNVAVDLPDKGAVRVMAATRAADVPAPVPVKVDLEGPRDWAFAEQATGFGLTYFNCDAPVKLTFTNQAPREITCWPVIRVNGSQLQIDRTVCPKLPITLPPGEPVTVPLVLNLRRVSPGPHAVQVHFLEDPLSRLHTFDVTLKHAP